MEGSKQAIGKIETEERSGEKTGPSIIESLGKDSDKSAPGNKEMDDGAAGMTTDKKKKRDDEMYSFGGGADKGKADGVSGLKAGFADDNRQFNYFVDFLRQYSSARHIPINVSERIVLKIKDSGKATVHDADVKIYDRNSLLFSGKTYSDGTFPFFPSEFEGGIRKYRAVISYDKTEKSVDIARYGKRDVDVDIPVQRTPPGRVPLDICFIFDTTGSMSEEIARLKRTIELIYLNLTALPSHPLVRFGMVLYKDRRDEYVTRVVPLTGNLEEFQRDLNSVTAGGGGDLPEDLQAALHDAMIELRWNQNGIRLCFIITDAPAHLDYGQQYTYYSAVRDARRLGIKVFSVGTGGLDINGEYVMRQISQYTSAKYIFLTYGEKGESQGGAEGSVSHHTGANFETDKLETIIMRFARNELYNLSREKEQADEEYFTATKISTEKNEETLQKLFGMAASQLSDYSSISIQAKTPTSVLPIATSNQTLKLNAEYFTEQLVFSLSKNSKFSLVERKNLQGVLKELELSMVGLTDEGNAAKVGKLLGAKMLVTGTLYGKEGDYELFLKLLRVETAEVLSVTKAKISRSLGISKK